ncbi:MAG: hypothetical protein HKM95_15815, partial [Inquilinus sp.]|nr:hypothetical protein [Inquilinus sp.]
VAARLPAGSQGAARIAGATGGTAWEREAPLTIARDAGGVAALWARSKIAELERERYRGADPQAIRDGILEVALAHGLVSDYTSLVAVDSVVARPPAAPLETEAVAVNMPAGVTMSMAGGAPATPSQPTPEQRDAAVDAGPPAPDPASLAAIRAMATTGTPFVVARLPGTATPAQLNLIFGAACLVLAALLLWLARRRGGLS